MTFLKALIIFLGLTLCICYTSLAQAHNSFFNDRISLELSTNFQLAENDSYSDHKLNPWIAFALTESMILGFSYLTTYTYGAYFVGATFAGSSALLIGYNIFTDYETAPFFTIPYAIGLASLSYYNFKYADKHSGKRKFITNFAGFNAALFTAPIVAILFKHLHDNNLKIEYNGSGISLVYSF